MEIRLAEINDFEKIKILYKNAREFMVKAGNVTQWQDVEQLIENVKNDILSGKCYVYVDNNNIEGVFCFFVGNDPTYDVIYDGKWLNNAPYGVIHRIAVGVHQKGIATKCIQWCLNKCSNIRIDTHKDNIPMQKTILKNGFKYCGIIKKVSVPIGWLIRVENLLVKDS